MDYAGGIFIYPKHRKGGDLNHRHYKEQEVK